MGQIAPPYQETVQKYAKETGLDLKTVTDAIEEHRVKLRTKNLNVAAWSYVLAQGKAPPALKADSIPFVMSDKPWLTIAEILKPDSGLAENTGFNLRGYVFGQREWTSKEGKPGLALTIGDDSGVSDVAYFGKQVEAIKALDLQDLDAIFVSQAQLSRNTKDQKLGIRCTGNYSTTQKITPSEKNLGPVTAIAPSAINQLQVYQSAMIRGLAFDQKPFSYVGCPKCMSKLSSPVPEGKMAECPGNPEKRRASCGLVTSTKHSWATIRINDDDGEIACKFSPDFHIDEETAKKFLNRFLLAVGTLSDKGDFNVLWFTPEDEVPAPAPAAVPVETPVTVTVTTPTVTTPQLTNVSTPTVTVTVPTNTPAIGSAGIGPVLLRWLKLFTPAPEDALIAFATTKGVSKDEAKSVIAELLEFGQVVRDPSGKIRSA